MIKQVNRLSSLLKADKKLAEFCLWYNEKKPHQICESFYPCETIKETKGFAPRFCPDLVSYVYNHVKHFTFYFDHVKFKNVIFNHLHKINRCFMKVFNQNF
jgi:hypothetical protein